MWHWPQGTTALRSFSVAFLDLSLLSALQPCMLQRTVYIRDLHSHTWRPWLLCLFTTTPWRLPVLWVNSEMHRKYSLQFFKTKLYLVKPIRVPIPLECKESICVSSLLIAYQISEIWLQYPWNNMIISVVTGLQNPLIFKRQLCSPLHYITTEPLPLFDCNSLSKFIYYIFSHETSLSLNL